MENLETFRVERDGRGVLTATLDLPGAPVNVIDERVVRDLAALLDRIQSDPAVRAVVFRGGKKSGFLAGADVKQIQRLRTPEEVETVLRAGQELFDRLEALPVPTVAAVHGPCLGGGLEFALACTYRVARDDGSTRLGLPETQLGVIPGWGGTQRLPRLVGQGPALRMILAAKKVSAGEARKLGLVDRVVPPERFDAEVAALVDDLLAGRTVARPGGGAGAWLRDRTWLGRRVVRHFARKQVEKQGRHYPALAAALRAVEEGLTHGPRRGLEVEREEFARLLFAPTCRNLLDLFFWRERARRPATWVNAEGDARVEAVAVIGAGVMGAGIAQAAATSGYRVVLKDINDEITAAGMRQVETLTRDAARKGVFTAEEADAHLARVTGTSEWGPVGSADLAVEAVVERMGVKQEVFRELDRVLPTSALIASNTSALPVGELAAATRRPSQVAGLHFFNPVHRMPLVEVVRAAATDDRTVAALIGVVRRLGKVPVVVSDSPGFLVNRVLFPYLDEAVRLALEGVPVEEVDREAKRFGMPMGPLELLDTVGVDVAADVSDTLTPLGTEESPTPATLKQMADRGRRGKKSGQGFYTYRKGRKGAPAPIEPAPGGTPRLPEPAELGGETLGGVQQRLVLPMINEAARCIGEGVVREAWAADLAMVLGTGFAPFRGGPLRLADHWGIPAVVRTMERAAETAGPRFRPCARLLELRDANGTFHGSKPEAERLQAVE